MPCLLALIAVLMPRFALFLVWLFSDFLGRAYETVLWPLLGFFFMPLTVLAYAAAINYKGEVTGGYFVLVLVAAIVDLGLTGRGSQTTVVHMQSQRRRERYLC